MSRHTTHARKRRRQLRTRHRSQVGAAPGQLIATKENAVSGVIQVIAYGIDRWCEEIVADPGRLPKFVANYTVTWINVAGLGDVNTIQAIGRLFALHPLALEDVVNVHQRAKVEPYDEHLFICARMPVTYVAGNPPATGSAELGHLESEQVSFFLGPNFVITFQERPGDCFDAVRDRLRRNLGRIRRDGADYLTYALLDAVVDSYFPVVEHFADELEAIEDDVAQRGNKAVIDRIHLVRNELLLLRRNVRPHRESFNELIRDQHAYIRDETRVFLRDCYDHTIQLIDLLEVYREMCGDLRDYYLTIVSNRMNEVMKVLTIISTIFIPLGFVAGLYGMNFDTRLPGNMPELGRPYAYLVVLCVMGLMTAGMLYFFYRRGWLRQDY